MKAALLIAFAFLANSLLAENWPAGCDPAEVGNRLAENLLARQQYMLFKKTGAAHYGEACAGYGALRFAGQTKNVALRDQLVARYSRILTPEGAKYIPREFHVDHAVFGIIPLEIARQTGDQRYLEIGKTLADAQWEKPTPEGLTRQTRWWIDDMYMIGSLQIEAYRATNAKVYADRVATELAAYLDKLQQPNGLFFHGPNAQHHWARGNGWSAAALTEVLSSLPKDHPQYARLLDGYRRMMAALLKEQGRDGLWRQLIDNPQAWPETSGSAMFTYAFVTGVNRDWLEKNTYEPAARKAWIGLCRHLDAKANLRDICAGTGQSKDANFYLRRPRVTGDLHGQAPMLWAACALLETP